MSKEKPWLTPVEATDPDAEEKIAELGKQAEELAKTAMKIIYFYLTTS